MAYAEIFADLPQELRLPIARLVDTLRDELAVGRADFEELKAIVRELAQAQTRTEVGWKSWSRPRLVPRSGWKS